MSDENGNLWAREAGHDQPLTTCVSGGSADPQRVGELSDVISFHDYSSLANAKNLAGPLLAMGRPVLCTEWMARTAGSRFETHLPYFKENKIGCWNWGLVAGRTQTYFPWGSPKGAPEPKLWFHDILRTNGTPFDAREVQFIKVTTGKLSASALPQRKMLVPTAEKSSVPWHYTLEQPAADWFKPGFAASGWQAGAAPFGTQELPIARKPNTQWTSADIWLRREFDWPADLTATPVLLVHHDEDVEIYVNGVLAGKAGGFSSEYEELVITPEGVAAFKPGKNLLAVHCHQTTGGQYIDVGIFIEVAGSK